MTTKTKSLKKFAARVEVYAVKGNATRSAGEEDKWQKGATAWTVVLSFDGRSLAVEYWTGSAIKETPTAYDVLGIMILDANMDGSSFEEWCGKLGYLADSRKAEKLYDSCIEQRAKLRGLLGDSYAAVLEMEAE